MDDFPVDFSYGFRNETMEEFLRKSMDVVLEHYFDTFLDDPLKEILEEFLKQSTEGVPNEFQQRNRGRLPE